MSWHAEDRSKDGKMRHPSDSPAWRNVDCRWPKFSSEAKNIRLGLATDGINPHNNGLNNLYGCWPVILVMYNLPPWLCMKRKFMMLSTLIYGPYEPGNNIDIYLQPMIDDLKKLWEEGEINVYDSHSKSVFTLKEVLMWMDKDSVASHLDMIDMGVRTDLAPEIVAGLPYPTQQLLPVCIRSVVPKNVRSYVRNRFYPEGCIVEGYLEEESAEFCPRFFSKSGRTAGLQKDDDKFSGPVGRVTMKLHKEHLERIYQGKKKSVQWLLGEHNRQFPDWFQQKVSIEMRENSKAVSETIRWLAGKPSFSVLTYKGYIVDGVRYHTKERDNARCELTFYGIVQEIWELDYHAFKTPLFLCTWAATDRGVKSDDLGFTLMNFNRPGHKQEKFTSVDQVSQVFYVEDPCDANWSVMLSSTTRDYHDVYNEDVEEETSWNPPPFCYDIPLCDPTTCDDDASVSNKRQNVEGIWMKKS
ncbi:uncharacterized protein LOC141679509 [Apium graveolens]|uniref:uncharacterized protein LOC141679509 n=1 Tax=Apium graveolens TaxID=4045 RepID=UPI003D7C036A